MFGGNAPPDRFIVTDFPTIPSYNIVSGLSLRTTVINPAVKTLVLFVAGQSNYANVLPTVYVPSNGVIIDQMNIHDGAFYDINGPLLGAVWLIGNGGNIGAYVADLAIANSFNRVIVVALAVNGTTVAHWATGGQLEDRIPHAMRRLASRGIVPGMTGVTFAVIWGQGETDNTNGNTQAAYTASFNEVVANAAAAGFVGRWFVNQQTWSAGVTSAAVRAAQAAVVNGSTVFAGYDFDTIDATGRQGDNIHLSNAGCLTGAIGVWAAMHASGSPY